MSSRRFQAVTAPLFAAVIASCATVAVNPATEEAAIRARSAEWNRAVTAKDVNAVVGFFTPDAILMEPNMAPATGTEAIRRSWQGTLALPNLAINWQPTRITVAGSGDVATEVGTYTFGADSPMGRISDAGSYTTVWRKVDGTWLVASDVITSSQPLPQLPPPGPATVTELGGDMEARGVSGLTWIDAVVPGFNPGMKLAVIHGDPGGTGDYTIRLRFPDGYEFPPHWHPMGEHITVLSGVFRLGMGGTFNVAAIKEYHPGDFLYAPGRMPHFGGARGETVIQLHGMGPFAINLGSP